ARLEGEAFVVADRALFSDTGSAAVSASENGVLMFLDGSSRESDSRLAWFDRSGKLIGLEGALGAPSTTSLSPDERTIAVLRKQAGDWTAGDIWLREANRDVGETRLTFDTTVVGAGNIVWSPDGTRIAFSS